LFLFLQILTEDSRNEIAIAIVARVHINNREITDGMLWTARLNEDGPNWETAVVLRAKCLIEDGNVSLAESTLENHGDKASSLLWLELARLRIQRGNDSETLAALRQVT